MEISLDNVKHPFKKLSSFLLFFFKDSSPNRISLMLIPIGFMTAVIYYFAATFSLLYWFGMGFIVLRMIVSILDNMMTEALANPNSTIIHKLALEAADMMFILALILANGTYLLGLFVLLVCWGVSYTGLIGLVVDKKIQTSGPMGQIDRIAVLIIFTVMQLFSTYYQWQFNFMSLFLWWVLLGGAATIALRCYKTLR